MQTGLSMEVFLVTGRAEVSNEEVREIWDGNAPFWDDYMKEGNRHSKEVIWPAQMRLLGLSRGESVSGDSVRERQLRSKDGESGGEGSRHGLLRGLH